MKYRKMTLMSIPILLLISFWFGALMELEKTKAEIKRDMISNLALVESKVGLIIHDNIDKMRGLATHISLQPDITMEDTNYFIEKMLETDDNIIKNVGVFEDTTAIYVYPYDENKAMDHIDLLDLPSFREDALRVKERYDVVITPPSEVLQGGLGVIIRIPIVLRDNEYWGQIGYMMKYDEIIQSLDLNQEKYKYKIEQYNKDAQIEHVIIDSGFNGKVINDSVVVKLPSCDWLISISIETTLKLFSPIFLLMASAGILFYYMAYRVIKDLEFSQFMTRGIVESSPDFIIITDENRIIVDCSSLVVDVLNCNKELIMGSNIDEILESSLKNSTENSNLKKLSSSPINFEIKLEVFKNHESRFFSFREIKMTKNRGYLLLGHDVDELKKQELETEKARMLAEETALIQSRFLANMSHEIRTPMNGIIGMVELSLLEKLDLKVFNYLSVAKSSAKSLLTILNDILDFSKLEEDKMTVSTEILNLTQLIEEIEILFAYTAKEKNLAFNVAIEENMPKLIMSDSVRIRQVITNLLSNAFKFTSKGSVSLSLELVEKNSNECTIRFSVVDTGMGISEEGVKNLFQRFNQLDDSITRKFGGTGLGLAISDGLVERLGGQIQCISKEGVGSTFEFKLNVEYSDAEPLEKHDSISDAISKTTSAVKSVLVVDDDIVNQMLMDATIKKIGHRVSIAKNGSVAIELCKAEVFDIILMDINMPILDGYQATKQIRQLKGYSSLDIPIIALTAYALESDKQILIGSGFDDYMIKPIEIRTVARKINKWTH